MKDVKCSKCGSKQVIKKGKRKQHFERVQVYYCKNCGRSFIDRTFKHGMYPARVVYAAINY